MASNILRRSNFIKVLEEAFGNEQWRQCNLFGVKQGGFGTVFAIQFNGTNYCLKVQNEPINERGAQEFQLEANISRSLNICSTCKVIRSFNPQSNGLAWILYEYIPGCTLYDLINKTHLHSIPNYDLFLMKALISSYKTIVELNTNETHIICHRDINPKNIMVTADGVAFIIDFGQSRMSSPASVMQSERTELRGTAAYRPSFSYSEGVVLYRTIYDITGWTRTFISVAASEWLQTPTRIPYLEPKCPKY